MSPPCWLVLALDSRTLHPSLLVCWRSWKEGAASGEKAHQGKQGKTQPDYAETREDIFREDGNEWDGEEKKR